MFHGTLAGCHKFASQYLGRAENVVQSTSWASKKLFVKNKRKITFDELLNHFFRIFFGNNPSWWPFFCVRKTTFLESIVPPLLAGQRFLLQAAKVIDRTRI